MWYFRNNTYGRKTFWWCEKLTTTPTPLPLCHWQGGGREKWEWSWSREEARGVGECFKIEGFIFLLSCSDLIGNKLNSFPQVKPVLPYWAISPCPYFDSRAFCYMFSPLSSWRRGMIGFSRHQASRQGQPTTGENKKKLRCTFSLNDKRYSSPWLRVWWTASQPEPPLGYLWGTLGVPFGVCWFVLTPHGRAQCHSIH